MTAHPTLILPEDEPLADRLKLERFPRSAAYNPRWALENLMGPSVLWLAESLTHILDLKPGMRVLDMGCGKAVSSIFLAREFGVEVWAADLWIGPTENWGRIVRADVTDRVFPIYAEAHSLPFAEGFFDALVSFDAYHYFGTNDLYLDYYSQFVKENGQIGMVVPGLREEFTNGIPDHLKEYWQPDFYCWHSPSWWRSHWEKSGKVEVTSSDFLPEGWKQWLLWDEVSYEYGFVMGQFRDQMPNQIETLRTDAGRHLGFTRICARKTPASDCKN